ncbi:MAG: hypothetical protein ACRDV3_16685, partial [Acidothermaceae bacterium]
HVREVRARDVGSDGEGSDGEGRDDVGPDTDEDGSRAHIPGVGPVTISESSHRVMKRGELVRRESLDGRPRAIVGETTMWIWLDGAELPAAFPKASTAWGWDDQQIVERPQLSRWDGNDFTRPTGPVEPVVLLGRSAWSVELAPPRHKPFPITIVVDAETGVLLQQRNDGFGSVVEWTEVTFGGVVPDQMFTWTGEVLERPDHDAEHEREMEERRQWLENQGIGALAMRVEPGLILHQRDDATGAFEASLQYFDSGSVLRRPRSAEPWDTRNNWPFSLEWSDDVWDWYLGARHELSPEQVADLRRQLGSPG